MTLDEKLNDEKTFDRRGFLKKSLNTLKNVLLAGVLSAAISCSTSSGPNNPPPKQYSHAVNVYATYFFSGSQTSGTYEVKVKSTGDVFQNIIGTKTVLPTTTRQTEICDIVIRADGAYPREFRNIPVTDIDLRTNVAEKGDVLIPWQAREPNKINFYALKKYVLFYGKNCSWTSRKIKVIFSSDPITGAPLEQSIKNDVITAINMFKDWSKGYITEVTFEDKNLPQLVNPSVIPPKGEVWCYKDSINPGVWNATFPTDNSVCDSSAMWYYVASTNMVKTETWDALIAHNQDNLISFLNLPEMVAFMMNRPRGNENNYYIDFDKESQEGIDTYSSVVTLYRQTVTDYLPDATAFPGTQFIDPKRAFTEFYYDTDKRLPAREEGRGKLPSEQRVREEKY